MEIDSDEFVHLIKKVTHDMIVLQVDGHPKDTPASDYLYHTTALYIAQMCSRMASFVAKCSPDEKIDEKKIRDSLFEDVTHHAKNLFTILDEQDCKL